MLDLPPHTKLRGHLINVLGTVNQAGAMCAQDLLWLVRV